MEHGFVGIVWTDPADRTVIGGSCANGGVGIYDGALCIVPGLVGTTVVGVVRKMLLLRTAEWLVRMNPKTGATERIWRHNDPTCAIFVRPSTNTITTVMWVVGTFTGLVVCTGTNAATPLPANIPATCVAWRATCDGAVSGIVCDADGVAWSFLFEFEQPTCTCLRLDAVGLDVLNIAMRAKLPAAAICAAVGPFKTGEQLMVGLADRLIVINMLPEAFASLVLPVVGGVTSIFCENNACWVGTEQGVKQFTADVNRNVASLA